MGRSFFVCSKAIYTNTSLCVGDTFQENSTQSEKTQSELRFCIEIHEKLNDKYGLVVSLNNMAYFLRTHGQERKAMPYASRSLEIAKELGYPDHIKNAAWTLKVLYEKQNKFKEALEMYELSMQMKDSISNEKTRKASIKKQYQIEYEREAIKDSITNVSKMKEEGIKHEQAITQQRTYTYGGFAGLALMIVVAGVSFKAFKNKQKANLIITEQKQFAEMQKHIIEEKQKEIIDSINYAQRIQRAHLPNEKYIARKISELKK